MKKKTEIAISIDVEILKQVEKFAKKLELSRSQMIENCVSIAIVDAKILESMGLMDLARLVRKVQEALGKKMAYQAT